MMLYFFGRFAVISQANNFGHGTDTRVPLFASSQSAWLLSAVPVTAVYSFQIGLV